LQIKSKWLELFLANGANHWQGGCTLQTEQPRENAMTRIEALQVAKANHAAHTLANIAFCFKRGPAFDELADFGYRHGWYYVGDYCFSHDEITGEAYDHTQGGWAFL
jgi:hypothetical protein